VVLANIDGHGELRTAEAIRIMKEIVPDVLIIAVSEELPIEDERELREAGLYYYLTRPLDESELQDLLTGAIAKQVQKRGTP
jgi:CheY-like chemotaxis protein